MLTLALTDGFWSYSNRAEHHDTVLWFDPDREYGVLPHLPSGGRSGIIVQK